MLEVLGRATLALYITYLLIFEINAVNRSYIEDNYFLTKRTSYRNKNQVADKNYV
jgi:hypothetical protein